jgi:ankyrin repeat protein
LEHEIDQSKKLFGIEGCKKMSLITSAGHNDLQVLKELIAGGADVNAVDEYGCTALWWMVERGQVECATALVDAKADVNKAANCGSMPLHQASNYGRPECVRVRRLCGCLKMTDVMPPTVAPHSTQGQHECFEHL